MTPPTPVQAAVVGEVRLIPERDVYPVVRRLVEEEALGKIYPASLKELAGNAGTQQIHPIIIDEEEQLPSL
jgi:hypothetical protein